jgi:glycosyltransferase involved in cell wall biosynthesis
VKLALVAWHRPEPEGTPTGRCLYALGEGLVAEGHEVAVWSWTRHAPDGPLPDWCEWRHLPPEPAWRTRGRALVRPRHDIVRAGWRLPEDAVGLADEPISWSALRGEPRSAVTFHYLTRLDAAALGRRSAKDVQDRRHEAFVARAAPAVLAFSERVGRIAGERTRVVPIAYPVPAEPLPTVDEPIALFLANWEWPPNVAALATMLDEWPAVRSLVPDARLLLAGWGSESLAVGDVGGVEVVGPVERAADVLARAAVLAFPCPPSSGPKVKVLEALAHGVPVVTTPAGVEGLHLAGGEGAVVVHGGGFAEALAKVLADPDERRRLGATGRAAIVAHHSPVPAARARVAALRDALGVD